MAKMSNWIIDHETRQINVKASFYDKAKRAGTSEAYKLDELHKTYPNYDILRRTCEGHSNKLGGISFAFMESYMLLKETDETYIAAKEEYNSRRLAGKAYSNIKALHMLQNWFLSKYPEVVQYVEEYEASLENSKANAEEKAKTKSQEKIAAILNAAVNTNSYETNDVANVAA